MRKLVLDTHVLLWAIGNSDKLPMRIVEHIANKENRVFVSAISLWEIAIKLSIGKLELKFSPEDILAYCQDMDIEFIPLEPLEALEFLKLPTKKEHKDPFDRMLVYQCIKGNYTLVSRDDKMRFYEKDGLKCIW
ncbi:MAG: type II toxin-antitoxin system VapC family toxin [Bacteroidales bacterium]|nr:type II toxin-antitoxin system VapC family toxin [Bacteroidales bacterium]